MVHRRSLSGLTARHTRCGALLLLLALAACGEGRREPRYPEERWSYAVSQILFAVREDAPGQALIDATRAIDQIRGGASFADLARARSEDESTRLQGGFLGFVNSHHETRFAGAIQALAVGQLAGPVRTEAGYHVLHRHDFEEGRRLEQKYYIPVQGFFVASREVQGGGIERSREEARAMASAARARIVAGEIDLETAAREYGDSEVRAGAFLGFVSPSPRTRNVYERIKDLPPGALTDVIEDGGAFGVLRRAPYYRAIVRHVLIRYAGARDTPMTVTLTREQAAARAREVLAEAAPDGRNWGDLVRRYSEDVASIPADGALGTFTNGDLPAPMEAVLLATRPGRIADQVAVAEDGVHVLWRVN
jgi:parvulin-like peptidyl-prolyl isomerase